MQTTKNSVTNISHCYSRSIHSSIVATFEIFIPLVNNFPKDQLKNEKQTEEGEKQDKNGRLGEDGEEEEEARCNKTDERIEIVQVKNGRLFTKL